MEFWVLKVGEVQGSGVVNDFFDGKFGENIFNDVIAVGGQIAKERIYGFGQKGNDNQDYDGVEVSRGGAFDGGNDGVNSELADVESNGRRDRASGIGGKVEAGPFGRAFPNQLKDL